MDFENISKKKLLEKKLKENSKKKKSILWAIFVSILSPFLLPLFPMKKAVNLASEIGYWNAVLFFGATILFLMPFLIYKEYDKMKRTQYDIERVLKNLK